jgi:hypothetical protein
MMVTRHAVGMGLVAVAVAGLSLVPLAARQDAGKEELKLKLPKPMFVGTPTNIKSANLEAVTGKSRGPFMVPVGTKLLSLKKPVKGSDSAPVIGELTMITDGEKEGGDGYFVELGPSKQWVQVDLGAPYALHAILLWHFHSQARVYRDVIVQVSDDKDFVKGVTTIFNNDHDNSSKLGIGKDKEYIEVAEGRLIDPKGIKGRYVRCYSNGNTTNDLNHYVEVEVHGTPGK